MKKVIVVGIAIGIAIVILISSVLVGTSTQNLTKSNQEPVTNPPTPPGKDLRINLSESVGIGEKP